MPANNLPWLIDHFTRFNGGNDPVLTTRFLKTLRHEANRLGLLPADLLSLVEQHTARAITPVPDAVPLRDHAG